MKIKELLSLPQTDAMTKLYHVEYFRKSTDEKDRQIQSIPDQKKACAPLKNGKTVIKTFEESVSAKKPGRPAFNAMIDLIEKRGDIKGIIAYDFSRLSRNPPDTARLQWLLQTGVIEEIVTPTRTYTEADADLLMSMEGAMANRYIRDLSRTVKRGLYSKAERGLAVTLAPVGYVNNTYKPKGQKDISPHPTYFPLVQKVFDAALTGNYSITQLTKLANDLGITNSRAKPISKTAMSEMLHNVFYTGRFLYSGQVYLGSHKAMLTDGEFDRLQDVFDNPSRPRNYAHRFAFLGMIKCGECGCSITAEQKTKNYKNGRSQTFAYYRCTKKKGYCSQGYIPEDGLNSQIDSFLKTVELPASIVHWAIKWLNKANEDHKGLREARYNALRESYDLISKKLERLQDMKLSPKNIDDALISNEEYIAKRQQLLIERQKVNNQLERVEKVDVDEWHELSVKTFNFIRELRKKFNKGTVDDKRLILSTIGSDLRLKNKTLEIQPRKPFKLIADAKKFIEKEKKWLEPKTMLLEQANQQFFKSPVNLSG